MKREIYLNLNGVILSESYSEYVESVGIVSVKDIFNEYRIRHDITRKAVRLGYLNAVRYCVVEKKGNNLEITQET